MSVTSPPIRTLADLLDRLGGVPLDRIRFRPYPGTATVQDVIDIQAHEDRLCELIDGVLVEKAPGFREAVLNAYLAYRVTGFVRQRNSGVVTGAGGAVELQPGLVRLPDLAFTSWDRLPGRCLPTAPVPRLAPDLAVGILHLDNTPGEMALKRQDYFTAGVRLVWEIDPDARTVDVYTSPAEVSRLTEADTLDGGAVLPGFTLPLRQLFAELDRNG
jgi:Uma2 family endonuclease